MPVGFPVVESRRNPNFKLWLEYARHADDPSCPWLPLGGWKHIQDLGRRPIELLLFSDLDDSRLEGMLSRSRRSVQLSPHLMEVLSQVKAPQSVLAFVAKPVWQWSDLTPWVVYADRLQDPGNLGTLLRTACATGIFSVVTSPGTVSCFNAKVVRASAASLYSVPFLESVALDELKRRRYQMWATAPLGGDSLFQTAFEPPAAFLMGNEGAGVDAAALRAADRVVTIPMAEGSDSLNAGVAAALVMYEVYRQRSTL